MFFHKGWCSVAMMARKRIMDIMVNDHGDLRMIFMEPTVLSGKRIWLWEINTFNYGKRSNEMEIFPGHLTIYWKARIMIAIPSPSI